MRVRALNRWGARLVGLALVAGTLAPQVVDPPTASAAVGDLDPTFATDGTALTNGHTGPQTDLLARLAESSGLPVARLGADAVKALVSYSFPGNVRELENILERALALSSGSEIRADDLLLDPADMGEASPATPTTQGGAHLQDFLDEVERHAIEEALEKSGGNRTAAARALGVTFRSLRYRLERLGMKE